MQSDHASQEEKDQEPEVDSFAEPEPAPANGVDPDMKENAKVNNLDSIISMVRYFLTRFNS